MAKHFVFFFFPSFFLSSETVPNKFFLGQAWMHAAGALSSGRFGRRPLGDGDRSPRAMLSVRSAWASNTIVQLVVSDAAKQRLLPCDRPCRVVQISSERNVFERRRSEDVVEAALYRAADRTKPVDHVLLGVAPEPKKPDPFRNWNRKAKVLHGACAMKPKEQKYRRALS